MLRAISLIAVLLASFAMPASAEDAADLRELSEAYIRHPVTQQMLDEMMSDETMQAMVAAQTLGLEVTLSDESLEALIDIVWEEMEQIRPKLETLMITAATQTFEMDELQALTDFLDSDAGARAMLKTGQFTQIFLANAGTAIQELNERISTRVEAELLN